MRKLDKTKTIQLIELLVWIAVIIATLVIVAKFRWDIAYSILQYLGLVALVISMYFYLRNRSLYHESRRKTAEIIAKQRLLRDRQKTINLIFDNSADGILILDPDHRIDEFSPGMEAISGYSRSEALGRDAQQLLRFSADRDHSLLPDVMFSLSSNSKNERYLHNSLINKTGKSVEFEASHTLLKDSKTNQTYALAMLRDISYEQEIAARDKEFIAVTSHQLNTPLSIIRGYASLMLSDKAGKLNQKQHQFTREILTSTEKMISLTNNMLSISRIEQDKIKLEFSDINLYDLIESLIAMFTPTAHDKKIKLILAPFDHNLVIMGDIERLSQALSNLIDNAIKYTVKGRVTLSVVDKSESVDIMIADTGIGIPREEIEKIGTRFYRSQNAIDVDNHGTGLGIFIAQTIINKHHGHLKIESVENRGARVIVSLPKKQPID